MRNYVYIPFRQVRIFSELELSKQMLQEIPTKHTIKKIVYWLNMQDVSTGHYQQGPNEHI
jgi:hypothetical protein